VIIPEATKKGYTVAYDGDGVYIDRPHQKRGVVQKGMIQTLKTNANDLGVIQNLRIRKLIPLETWRLMGISDEDFYKVKYYRKKEIEKILMKNPNFFSKHQKRQFTKEERIDRMSTSQCYKQAGNSIVVNVLMAIFRELF